MYVCMYVSEYRIVLLVLWLIFDGLGLPVSKDQVSLISYGLWLNFDDTFEQTGEKFFSVADEKVDLLWYEASGEFDEEGDLHLVEAALNNYLRGENTMECTVQELSNGEVFERILGLSLTVKNVRSIPRVPTLGEADLLGELGLFVS